MNDNHVQLSRRKLLAGLGCAGLLSVGAGRGTLALQKGGGPLEAGRAAPNLEVEVTLIDASGAFDLAVADGSSLTSQGDSVTVNGDQSRRADGLQVSAAELKFVLNDVKPGDWWVWKKCIRVEGAHSRVHQTTDPDGADPQDTDGDSKPELASNENTNAENGRTEPEADVDSTTGPGNGELGRYVRVRIGDNYGGGDGVGGQGPRGQTNAGTPISLSGDEDITFSGSTSLNPLDLFFQGTLNRALWVLGADMIETDATGSPVTDSDGDFVGVSDPDIGSLGVADGNGLRLSNPIDRGTSGSSATQFESTDRYDSDQVDYTAAGPGFGLARDNTNYTTVGPNGDTSEVCFYEKYFVPVEVGNEIQGDSISWQLTVQAEQIRQERPAFCQFPCTVEPPSELSGPLEFAHAKLPPTDELFERDGEGSVEAIRSDLNDTSGIFLTDEILDPSELSVIEPVADVDSYGGLTISRKAVVGSTQGEDVIDAGAGVTVENNGVIIGTVTNTLGNDVVVKTDGSVAGDIGVTAAGGRLEGTGNVKVESRATVVGDIVTNTGGKNVKVKYGERGDRSEVIGDVRTSGGGIEVVDYGRVSGTVETDNGGNITVNTKSRVDGDAITSGGGQITVGNSGHSQIGGTVDSTGSGNGNVDLNGKQQDDVLNELPAEPAKVYDGVRAGGQANLYAGAVKNGVVAEGDCDVDNSKICGSVVADGNVDVDGFCVIQGDEGADDIGIDLGGFNIVTDDGELGSNFKNFGTSSDDQTTNQKIREGSVIAGKQVSKVQNSFVGGDVIAQKDDIDVPSSVICGDVIAKEGAIDIYSDKTGPPKPIVDVDSDSGAPGLDLPRDETRRRSLIGGVVRVDGQDCDIAGATVFANGTTEPDERDDDVAVLVTQRASGGNGLTITSDDAGELESILKGDVVVNGELNVDIDSGSRVEGNIEANAGTVSLSNVTITGDAEIGSGGEIDQLDGGTVIEGDVRVESGGTLDVSGVATIEGALIVEPGGTVNTGGVIVEGSQIGL